MSKLLYLGHNKITNQFYVNDHGQQTTDKNITYMGPDNDLQAVIRYLADNYENRNAILKTGLPAERISELQKLVDRNKALKKMKLE
jgi:arginyl-tRNA synthetase